VGSLALADIVVARCSQRSALEGDATIHIRVPAVQGRVPRRQRCADLHGSHAALVLRPHDRKRKDVSALAADELTCWPCMCETSPRAQISVQRRPRRPGQAVRCALGEKGARFLRYVGRQDSFQDRWLMFVTDIAPDFRYMFTTSEY